MIVSVARFASVYPLVPARALARPFTYLADGLEKGSVVSVPFGRARKRGVVVELADEAPADVEPVAVARALGLVAPASPSRRRGAARKGVAYELPGEEAPHALTEAQEDALGRIVAA